MIHADSSVWIDYIARRLTPQVQLLFDLRLTAELGIGDIVVTEILQGVRSDAQFERVKAELLQLEVVPIVSGDVAIHAAENYRYLRRRGITIRSTIDCLIATYCIDGGHQLLHSDHDFDPFEAHLGLSVVR